VADGAELSERPELLAAYAATFSAADDATLVIRLGSGPAALEGLQAAVAAAGLDGDDGADLLAVPDEGDLAPCVDAVLSSRLPEGALAAVPCFDADGVSALSGLARGEGGAWCINICAPNWGVARSWGDLHFARALQQELHRAGRPCAIHTIDRWSDSRSRRFDVVLHLKGLTAYEPNPAQLNLLWSISHPEKLTVQECERSDLVLVASEAFAASLRDRVRVPVAVLEQATDPAVFFPEPDPVHARELVFVGNSRKVMRRILADLLPTDRDLAVWGGDWDGLVDSRHLAGTYLPNDEVRRAYSSAAIVLNDHWDDMREHGFASNRLYDAVACGALVLSDRLDGLEERFGGAVVTYETAEELRALVEHFLANPQERAERGAAGRELVLGHHTFARRVEALLAHVDAALAAAA
jgi:O-antigen biosynthesis protein